MRKIQKVATVAVTGAVALGAAGVAYSYWSTSGTGTGSGSTAAGASAAFAVSDDSSTAIPAGGFYPGDTARTVTATVKNNGSEAYNLAGLSAYLTIDGTHSSACSAGDYLLNGSAAPGATDTPADLGITTGELAASATRTQTFTLQFNDKSDTNQDGCKGATVTVHYSAS